MNLGALEGVNEIAVVYRNKANKLKTEKKINEALKLYLEIQKIRPENFEIRNSILLCENQIKYSGDNTALLNNITEASNNKEIDYRLLKLINQNGALLILIEASMKLMEAGLNFIVPRLKKNP